MQNNFFSFGLARISILKEIQREPRLSCAVQINNWTGERVLNGYTHYYFTKAKKTNG